MNFYKDKIILVFGSTSGVGLNIVEYFNKLGSKVIALGRNNDKLLELKQTVPSIYKTYRLDVKNEDEIKDFFLECPIYDFLVFTAVQPIKGKLSELTINEIKNAFQTKFWGQLMVVKYGINKITKNGSIVLFSGAYSYRPRVGSVGLSTINSAVESFVKCMALEIAPIRINAISPGLIDTTYRKFSTKEERNEYIIKMQSQIPLGRVANADEVTHTVEYLFKNEYTTGSTIFVDGGVHLV